MSIYDKSSLVLIPSGTKTGKVYSQKPVSGDGDFTFTRSSAATRVNADGLVEKETQNLLEYSNSFTSGDWDDTGSSFFTSGQSGYDGTNNAWLFTATSAGERIQLNISKTGVHTLSTYFKKGTADGVRMRVDSLGTDAHFYVNLIDGTQISASGEIATEINDIGSGWYRVVLTSNWINVSNIRIYPINTSGVDVSGTIYIQDAQLEQGLVARDYIETTTTAVEGGITDNVPRLDYTDSSCPALLLEPQRTNNLSHSEYHQGFLNAVTRTYNTTDTLSPEGYYNAVKYEVNANNSDPYVRILNIPTSGNVATFSLYVKGASGQLFSMIMGRDGYEELGYEAFTLDGTWQRLTLSKTFTTTPTTLTIGAEFSHSSDDGVLGQEYYVYGIQVEEGSYATSYIPTYGSSVTRVEDSCLATGVSDIVGQTEGTIFLELAGFDGNTHLVTLGDGTISNYLMLYISSGSLAWLSNSGLTGSAGSVTASSKVALAYKENDSVLYLDGNQVLTDTSNTIPSLPNIYLNNNATLSNVLRLETKQLALFKTRLTNAELAALTTI